MAIGEEYRVKPRLLIGFAVDRDRKQGKSRQGLVAKVAAVASASSKPTPRPVGP